MNVPYFGFLQLAVAICPDSIYTFTHFAEQSVTVRILNSKKHKHGRLGALRLAKHMREFCQYDIKGTRLIGMGVKTYLLLFISTPKCADVLASANARYICNADSFEGWTIGHWETGCLPTHFAKLLDSMSPSLP